MDDKKIKEAMTELELVSNKTKAEIWLYLYKQDDGAVMDTMIEELGRSQGHLNAYLQDMEDKGYVRTSKVSTGTRGNPPKFYSVSSDNVETMLSDARDIAEIKQRFVDILKSELA